MTSKSHNLLETLKERFIRGEISAEDYKELKTELEARIAAENQHSSSAEKKSSSDTDPLDQFDDPSGTLLMLPRGMKLGDYEVVRMIGKGGMGVVYEALFHGLDHPVTRAIKTVPPLVSSNPKAISDLKREVRIAQELGHPHIVKTYNLEQIRDKTFIVMECIKGQDLASYLDDQPDRTLPLERVVELLKGVADALDFAHSLNPPVIHRDMKPENLLFDSRDGRLKITDFGLAREVADTMSRLSVLSQNSGTPLYMPYEQFMGDIPTPSVDIYALGIIAYEMLSGKPPFFRGDIMAQHREKAPRRIEGVSESVMTALQTVLAKDQEDRYSKATLFIEALTKPAFPVCPECGEARDVKRFTCSRCGVKELCRDHQVDGRYCPECGEAIAEKERKKQAAADRKRKAETERLAEEKQLEKERLRKEKEEQDRKQREEAELKKQAETEHLEEKKHLNEDDHHKRKKRIIKIAFGWILGIAIAIFVINVWLMNYHKEQTGDVIRMAESQLKAAIQSNAEEYSPKSLENSRVHFRDAGILYAQGNYKDSKKKAELSLKSGEEAEINAKRLASSAEKKRHEEERVRKEKEKQLESDRLAEKKRLETELARKEKAEHARKQKEEAARQQREAEESKRTTPGALTAGPLRGMQFAYIPSGSFLMGSPEGEEGRYDRESPQHQVSIKPFHIMTTEVTQSMWVSVMGNNPSRFKGDNLPVECVSWDDIQEFIKKLNQRNPGKTYRLPTEAEWEYACRSGTTRRFYSGDSDSDLDRVGWYSRNSGSKTHPVGQKQPNSWGLYDMHGNVWEWCGDVWHGDYKGAPSDGSAWTKGGDQGRRVLRGGSWGNDPEVCRSAYRLRSIASLSYINYGFRLVFA